MSLKVFAYDGTHFYVYIQLGRINKIKSRSSWCEICQRIKMPCAEPIWCNDWMDRNMIILMIGFSKLLTTLLCLIFEDTSLTPEWYLTNDDTIMEPYISIQTSQSIVQEMPMNARDAIEYAKVYTAQNHALRIISSAKLPHPDMQNSQPFREEYFPSFSLLASLASTSISSIPRSFNAL